MLEFIEISFLVFIKHIQFVIEILLECLRYVIMIVNMQLYAKLHPIYVKFGLLNRSLEYLQTLVN